MNGQWGKSSLRDQAQCDCSSIVDEIGHQGFVKQYDVELTQRCDNDQCQISAGHTRLRRSQRVATKRVLALLHQYKRSHVICAHFIFQTPYCLQVTGTRESPQRSTLLVTGQAAINRVIFGPDKC